MLKRVFQVALLVVVMLLWLLPQVLGSAAGCDLAEGLHARLIRHEGVRTCVYDDVYGNATIGVGHLLRKPVYASCWPRDHIMAVFHHDIARARAGARSALGSPLAWTNLAPAQREVLVEMAFWLGPGGLRGFHRMLGAVRAGDMTRAAAEIEDSKIGAEFASRAGELACILREAQAR